MSILDRVLDDGSDRTHWLNSRRAVIGASDAAKLAKASSVELYLASKLKGSSFSGNDTTESGHRWEKMMLAWAGIPQNVALIHAPDEPGFAATPDGLDGQRLAECKAKHNQVVTGPTLGEWRQLAWQFRVIPEAETTEFLWVELVKNDRGVWVMRDELHGQPKHLVIPRDHPKIVTLTQQIEPIATELLDRLRLALSYERTAA